jgi:hypothetical protein
MPGTNRAQLRLRVYLDGREPFDVETRLADHNHWDMTRARHKWPETQEAPVTWLGFMAWSAARRTNAIDISWEDFLEKCEGVENLDGQDAEPVEPVNPTVPVLGPDSSVS